MITAGENREKMKYRWTQTESREIKEGKKRGGGGNEKGEILKQEKKRTESLRGGEKEIRR